MSASCDKSNDGKSNRAAHGTEYDVTQQGVQTPGTCFVCSNCSHELVLLLCTDGASSKNTIKKKVQLI